MSWTQSGSVLTAADGAVNDGFGSVVAVSKNGQRLVVGALGWEGGSGTNRGGVYTYTRSGSSWVADGSVLTPGDAVDGDGFGHGIALNGDGSVLAVASMANTGAGKVYLFEYDAGTWVQTGTVVAPDAAANDNFGWGGLGLSETGVTMVVGAPNWEGATGTNRGGVYVFDLTLGSWVQRGSVLVPSDAADSDGFGRGVAVSADGYRVAVGAYTWEGGAADQGGVYTFDWSGSAWVQYGSVLVAPDAGANDAVFAVALSAAGDILIVGSAQWDATYVNQGAFYAFDDKLSGWTHRNTTTGPAPALNQAFGFSVAVDDDAMLLVVGAPQTTADNGIVYTFDSHYFVNKEADSAFADSSPSSQIAANNSELQTAESGDSHSLLLASITTEDVVCANAFTYDVVQWFYEAISAADTPSTQATTSLSYAEQVAVSEALISLFNQLVAESSSASEAWYVGTAAQILDIVLASGVYANHSTLTQALAEAIVAIELQGTGGLAVIAESVEADEAVTNLLRATQAVLDSILAQDAQTSYLLLINTVSEGVSADETVTIWQSLTQAIEEGAEAFIHLVFNGETFTGWVLNTSNTAVSEYQGLNFNSMCRIGNRYFGAASEGIYELTGAQDSGVDVSTYIQSGLLDFGSTQQKAVPDAYLAVDANGRVALGVSVSEKTQISTYWYEANRELEAINNVKVPIGKGLKGRYWKFEIASDAVSEFDAVTVLSVVLARRV